MHIAGNYKRITSIPDELMYIVKNSLDINKCTDTEARVLRNIKYMLS